MVLLLQGRGYNLRRGVHFRDGGTSASSHEGGTVAVSLVCPCSARRTTGPSRPRRGEPPRSGAGCRAWTRRSSTCAPRRRARRGEPMCALASAVASDEDWTRERSCALCTRFAPAEVSAYASPSPRRVATSVGYHPPVSLEGGTDPLGTCSRPMGGGTINRGGTLNRT